MSYMLTRRSLLAAAAAGLGALTLSGCEAAEGEQRIALTFALASPWDTLNPYTSNAGSFAALVQDKIFDKIGYINEDFEVEPRAASSWDLSDDGMSITFHLDRDATFHDGVPVTADDWLFTMGYVTSADVTLTSHSFARYLEGTTDAGIETSAGSAAIEKLDDYTVVCHLKRPYALQSLMESAAKTFHILPAHCFEGMTYPEVTDAPYWSAPVGSGPCSFSSMVSGTSITLDAYADYHLGPLAFDEFTFQVMAQSNFVNSIMAGDADLTYTAIPTEDALVLKDEPAISITRQEHPTFLQVLAWNNEATSANMRRAVNFGIDKQLILDEYYEGEGKLTESVILPDSPYFKGNEAPRDVDQARSYFEAAIAAGEWQEGAPIIIGVNTTSRQSQGAVIQQNLAEIGLDCQIQMYDSATMWAYLRDGTIHGCLMGLMPTNDPMSLYSYFDSSYAQSTWFHVNDERFDDIINKLEVENDEDAKRELCYQFQDVESDIVPFSWICAQYSFAATSPRLGNADPFASDQFNNAVWKWTVAA